MGMLRVYASGEKPETEERARGRAEKNAVLVGDCASLKALHRRFMESLELEVSTRVKKITPLVSEGGRLVARGTSAGRLGKSYWTPIPLEGDKLPPPPSPLPKIVPVPPSWY